MARKRKGNSVLFPAVYAITPYTMKCVIYRQYFLFVFIDPIIALFYKNA